MAINTGRNRVTNPGLDDEEDDEEDDGTGTPAPSSTPDPTANFANVGSTPTSGIDQDSSAPPPSAPTAPEAPEPSGDIQDPKSLASNLRGSKYYLGEYEKLSNDPKYASQLPPDTRADLKKALDDAKQMYDEKTSRNDWMEVAQTLTRAMAQYGAARAGLASDSKYGRDMSNLQFGPGINFDERNKRAMNEYNQDIGQAGELNNFDRQAYLDKQRGNEMEYGNKAGFLKEAINASNTGERTNEQERAANLRYNAAQARADAREKAAGGREDQREKALQYRELDSQEKSLQKQLQAGMSLANNLQSEDSLNSKDAEKLKAKYGQQAAAAGVDLPSAVSQYQQNAPKRNRKVLGMGIPGTETTDTESPQNKQSLYDALGISDKLKELEAIKARKQSISGGSSPQAQAPAPQSAAPAAATPATPATPGAASIPSDRVMVRSPKGDVGSIPKDKLQDAISQGYTVVQ